jgi:hypothetical protein
MSFAVLNRAQSTELEAGDLWIPLYSWARELPDFHCRLNIYPRIVTREANDRFRCRLRFYSREPEPLGEYLTEEVTGDSVLRVPLRKVADAMGLPTLRGIMEVHTFQVNNQPVSPRFLKCWMDYESADGRWFASLPCAPFRGARKSMLSPESQVQPGIVADDQFRTYLLAINPMPRSASFTATAYNAAGVPRSGFRHELQPHDYLFRPLEEIYPDLRQHFAPGGIGSIRLDGDYKLLGWYIIENRATGVVRCMDHFAPFFRDIRSDSGA